MRNIILILSLALVFCQFANGQVTTLDAKIELLSQRVNELQADIIENDWIVALAKDVPEDVLEQMVLDSQNLKKESTIASETSKVRRFLFVDNATREEIDLFVEKYNEYITMVEPNASILRIGYFESEESDGGDELDNRKCRQQNVDWGLDRIDQTELPLDGIYRYAEHKQEITVYVLDTGIDSAHEDFGGRAESFSPEGIQVNDNDGHGTHVAGTIGSTTYGVSKRVKLVGVQVINCCQGTTANILKGLQKIEDEIEKSDGWGKSVVNMSLGYDGDNPIIEDLINDIGKRVPFVVAAGNDGINVCHKKIYNLKEVIPVASTTISENGRDVLSSFSNRGKCIAIYAPGSTIRSLDSQHRTCTCNEGKNTLPNQYRTLSGTSMASPMVAGWASMILQENPGLSSSEMKKEMQNRAIRHRDLDPFHNNARFIYNNGIKSNVGVAGVMILTIMVLFM